MSFDKRIAAALPIDQARHFETGETLEIETLVRVYYPDVLRLCESILSDPADAEDVTQETFIAAASGLSSFRGEARVKTWLFGIALNLSRSMLRKQKRRANLRQALQSVFRLPAPSRGPEDHALRSETSRQLQEAIHALDEKQRIAVLLYYVHDLSVPEISKLLETNPGTVHSRLHHARKKLHHLVRSG